MSLPTPTTAPLGCRCCCCCCVPNHRFIMCPSITGFPYRYVGAFYDGDMKKTTEKNGSVCWFRFFWATENPTLKSRFSVAKKKRRSVFGSQPVTLVQTAVQYRTTVGTTAQGRVCSTRIYYLYVYSTGINNIAPVQKKWLRCVVLRISQ